MTSQFHGHFDLLAPNHHRQMLFLFYLDDTNEKSSYYQFLARKCHHVTQCSAYDCLSRKGIGMMCQTSDTHTWVFHPWKFSSFHSNDCTIIQELLMLILNWISICIKILTYGIDVIILYLNYFLMWAPISSFSKFMALTDIFVSWIQKRLYYLKFLN